MSEAIQTYSLEGAEAVVAAGLATEMTIAVGQEAEFVQRWFLAAGVCVDVKRAAKPAPDAEIYKEGPAPLGDTFLIQKATEESAAAASKLAGPPRWEIAQRMADDFKTEGGEDYQMFVEAMQVGLRGKNCPYLRKMAFVFGSWTRQDFEAMLTHLKVTQ